MNRNKIIRTIFRKSSFLFFILSLISYSFFHFLVIETHEKDMALRKNSEPHRPKFHFTPPTMWMNDPNGMVYFEGEYHLFYQHYPDKTVWGPMHWGHAVSKDLVDWEHLPIALYPDSLGYIFSGSAVVDHQNTSGFGSEENPPMVAIFTYHNDKIKEKGGVEVETQGIAYSLDKGRTWTKYNGNPVVKNPGIIDFRDPNVFWHESSKKWVMILAVKDRVAFYNSPDLKSWEKTGEFGSKSGSHVGVWECPDLFQLPVDNKNKESKWVMLLSVNGGGPNGGSATQYFIGDFDGKTFTNENSDEEVLWVDYGKDNYAGVTWSDIPEKDGRRIFIGWMSNWEYANVVPTEKWRNAMTIPRTLSLKNTEKGIRLANNPVKEVAKIREESVQVKSKEIEGVLDVSLKSSTLEATLEFDISNSDADSFGIEIYNNKGEKVRIGFSTTNENYFIDRTQAGKMSFSKEFAKEIHPAPRMTKDNIVKLHLLFDVASVELFADDGLTVMTDIFFPNEDFQNVRLFSEGGKVKLKSGKFFQLI